MGKRGRDFQWIGNVLDGRRISFTESKTTWQLTHKITEKTCQIRYPLPFESVTVFICEQVSGHNIAWKAIMKIRTDIPETEFPHPNPAQRGIPSEDVNWVTAAELDRLDRLTNQGCSSTPRLLDYERGTQDTNMWFSGGYIVYILMELLPGIPLDNFWELPRAERDQVRKAFRVALEEIWQLSRIDLADSVGRNIIWDREKQKCYIVDFEICDEFKDRPEHEFKFSDRDYVLWDLAQRNPKTRELEL